MRKNTKMLFENVHQSFLENQTRTHNDFLHSQQHLYQKMLQVFSHNKSSPSQKGKTIHKYLFDPKNESWIKDHCPTFTRPALAMTSIVDIMASQCEEHHPNKKLIAIKDVRVFQWAIMDRPKMMTIEINRINNESSQVAISLQEKDDNVRLAKATLVYSDSYPQPVSTPATVTTNVEEIINPYSYLFHGPAFQTIHSLVFGQEGSTLMLKAHNPLGPTGCLNHILLDGATQGVYHENGLSFWDKDLPDNHVCYPALIKHMHLYGQTPTHGTVRCETRFIGYHYSKTLPAFHMTLIINNMVWCEFELVYAVLPMGFLGMANVKDKKNFSNFIKNKCYTPDIHLADLSAEKAALKIKTMQGAHNSQWFPHLIEDIYEINEDVDMASLTRQVLVKDYFASRLKVHPSEILLLDDHTVTQKNVTDKYYYYSVERLAEEFSLEMKTEKITKDFPFDNNTIFSEDHIIRLINCTSEPIIIVKSKLDQKIGLLPILPDEILKTGLQQYQLNLMAILPPLLPEVLGNKLFTSQHGLRYPYVVGEMAHGVATAKMVIAAAKSGMFAFFGAAGLMPAEIEKNIQVIRDELGDKVINWGSNLIFMPNEPELEAEIVDLYLRLNVRRVSASAYMALSPHIVRYAASGLTMNARGKVIRQNYVIAKLSRPEIAQHFISPPPQAMLDNLVAQGKITAHEASIASKIPVADSITVEADSGGHTDNRPLAALFSTIHKLSLELAQKYNYQQPIFIGAAGGLGTPASVAAAFGLGADYVLTGSINAAAVESLLSDDAKNMLAKAEMVDVMMAPAADMFELGVKLQILKRGTFFGPRATKLYELYQKYASLSDIPNNEKEKLEQQLFHGKLEDIWAATRQFFMKRDPSQVARAERDPKHLMALVFRWYLGQSTRWAIEGVTSRRSDYQIWCGPAIGAFNAWVAGSFLEDLGERNVVQIGKNLLEGAVVIMRAQYLRSIGMNLPSEAFYFKPRLL